MCDRACLPFWPLHSTRVDSACVLFPCITPAPPRILLHSRCSVSTEWMQEWRWTLCPRLSDSCVEGMGKRFILNGPKRCRLGSGMTLVTEQSPSCDSATDNNFGQLQNISLLFSHLWWYSFQSWLEEEGGEARGCWGMCWHRTYLVPVTYCEESSQRQALHHCGFPHLLIPTG